MMIPQRVREFWSASTRAEASNALYEGRREMERYFEKHSRKAFLFGFVSGIGVVVLFPLVVGVAALVAIVAAVRYFMKTGAHAVGQGS